MEATTVAEGTATEIDSYEQIRDRVVSGGRNMVLRYGIVALLSLGGTTALVRLLGAADWGIVSVGYYLVVFLDNNFGATLLGALVQAREEPEDELIGASVTLMRIVGGGVAALACAAAVPASLAYGRGALGWSLVAVAVCGLVYAWRATSLALIERRLDYATVARAEVLDQVMFYAVAIPAVALGGGLPAALVALAARGLLPALLLRRRAPVATRGRWRREQVAALYRFGAPNLGAALLILLNGLIPLILLSASQGAILGFVLTASTIAGYAATVQVIAQRLGFASLSRLQADPDAFSHASRRALSVSTFTVTAISVPLGALAPIWMPVLLGQPWRAAATIMAWTSAATVLLSAANIGTAVFLAQGRPRRTFALNLAATGVYLLLAAALVGSSARLALPIGQTAGRALAAAIALAWMASGLGRNWTLIVSAELAVGAAACPALAALVATSRLAGLAAVFAFAAGWALAHRGDVRFLVARVR
jgi:O-antigen/teichoic acid export membrane protein